MKIGDKRDDQDAVRILNSTLNSSSQSGKSQKKKDLYGREIDQDVTLQLGLGKSIGTELDPVAMASERLARVEALKKQVQNGTYVMPTSEELASKLSEEINFEILSSGEKKESEDVG